MSFSSGSIRSTDRSSRSARALAIIAAATLLVSSAVLAPAARAQLVVPGALSATEGNSNNSFPFNLSLFSVSSMRYQQIYSASEFGTGGTISQILFRQDRDTGAAFSRNGIDVKINLSYAATTVGTASSTFASNIGANQTTVIDGLITMSSAYNAGGSAVRPFDIVLNLNSTFDYDPTRGDLLMDVFMRNAPTTTSFDATGQGQQSVTQRIYSDTTGNVNATSGIVGFVAADSRPYGLVTAFTIRPTAAVPEPGTVALAVAGLLPLAGMTLHRRRK